MNNIINLFPEKPSSDPDVVLEQAKGDFKEVLIIGYGVDGFHDVRGTENLTDADVLHLMECFKHRMMVAIHRDVQEVYDAD